MRTTTIEKPTTTTQYWGYRELTADELLKVGGGDGDGDDGDDGDDSDDTQAEVPTLAEVTVTATPISDDQSLSLANAVQNMTGGSLGAGAFAAFLGNIASGVVSGAPSSLPPPGGELSYPGTGNPMGDPGPGFGDSGA